MIRIGTAGWSIPTPLRADFSTQGTHLQRYAHCFSAVEINSSFYRPHRRETYARWADCVPSAFRFAVKVPREITHIRRLLAAAEPLERFLSEAQALGDRLGPVLVQLPPTLRFDTVAGTFFEALRGCFDGLVVCEPRHPSWFADAAEALLSGCQIARVAADPAPVPAAATPGGWPGLIYRRLHGSPRMYYSAYPPDYLDTTANLMRASTAGPKQDRCILDNTALGAATRDALALKRRLEQGADDRRS